MADRRTGRSEQSPHARKSAWGKFVRSVSREGMSIISKKRTTGKNTPRGTSPRTPATASHSPRSRSGSVGTNEADMGRSSSPIASIGKHSSSSVTSLHSTLNHSGEVTQFGLAGPVSPETLERSRAAMRTHSARIRGSQLFNQNSLVRLSPLTSELSSERNNPSPRARNAQRKSRVLARRLIGDATPRDGTFALLVRTNEVDPTVIACTTTPDTLVYSLKCVLCEEFDYYPCDMRLYSLVDENFSVLLDTERLSSYDLKNGDALLVAYYPRPHHTGPPQHPSMSLPPIKRDSKLAMKNLKRVSPQHSIVWGTGNRMAFVGHKSQFMIQLCDKNGEPLPLNSDVPLTVKVTDVTDRGITFLAALSDAYDEGDEEGIQLSLRFNGSGMCRVTYVAKLEGLFELDIRFNGLRVHGSPFTVTSIQLGALSESLPVILRNCQWQPVIIDVLEQWCNDDARDWQVIDCPAFPDLFTFMDPDLNPNRATREAVVALMTRLLRKDYNKLRILERNPRVAVKVISKHAHRSDVSSPSHPLQCFVSGLLVSLVMSSEGRQQTPTEVTGRLVDMSVLLSWISFSQCSRCQVNALTILAQEARIFPHIGQHLLAIQEPLELVGDLLDRSNCDSPSTPTHIARSRSMATSLGPVPSPRVRHKGESNLRRSSSLVVEATMMNTSGVSFADTSVGAGPPSECAQPYSILVLLNDLLTRTSLGGRAELTHIALQLLTSLTRANLEVERLMAGPGVSLALTLFREIEEANNLLALHSLSVVLVNLFSSSDIAQYFSQSIEVMRRSLLILGRSLLSSISEKAGVRVLRELFENTTRASIRAVGERRSSVTSRALSMSQLSMRSVSASSKQSSSSESPGLSRSASDIQTRQVRHEGSSEAEEASVNTTTTASFSPPNTSETATLSGEVTNDTVGEPSPRTRPKLSLEMPEDARVSFNPESQSVAQVRRGSGRERPLSRRYSPSPSPPRSPAVTSTTTPWSPTSPSVAVLSPKKANLLSSDVSFAGGDNFPRVSSPLTAVPTPTSTVAPLAHSDWTAVSSHSEGFTSYELHSRNTFQQAASEMVNALFTAGAELGELGALFNDADSLEAAVRPLLAGCTTSDYLVQQKCAAALALLLKSNVEIGGGGSISHMLMSAVDSLVFALAFRNKDAHDDLMFITARVFELSPHRCYSFPLGSLQPLIKAVQHGDIEQRKYALICLSYLAMSDETKAVLCERGGAKLLTSLLDMVETTDLSLHQEVGMKEISLVKILGKGAAGTVWQSVWEGKDTAVKQFQEESLSWDHQEFRRELAIMSMVRHRNVVGALGGCTRKRHRMVVMELMECSLFDVISSKLTVRINNATKTAMLIDAAYGIQFLHNLGIHHRDIKCGNLLMDSDGVVKVADFGLSVSSSSKDNQMVAGTLMYTAPEILNGEPYTPAVDVYSFAFVMWELYHHAVVFVGMSSIEITSAVAERGERPEIDPRCPFKELIEECWQPEPSKRPSLKQIIEDLEALAHRFEGERLCQSNLANVLSTGRIEHDDLVLGRLSSEEASALHTITVVTAGSTVTTGTGHDDKLDTDSSVDGGNADSDVEFSPAESGDVPTTPTSREAGLVGAVSVDSVAATDVDVVAVELLRSSQDEHPAEERSSPVKHRRSSHHRKNSTRRSSQTIVEGSASPSSQRRKKSKRAHRSSSRKRSSDEQLEGSESPTSRSRKSLRPGRPSDRRGSSPSV